MNRAVHEVRILLLVSLILLLPSTIFAAPSHINHLTYVFHQLFSQNTSAIDFAKSNLSYQGKNELGYSSYNGIYNCLTIRTLFAENNDVAAISIQSPGQKMLKPALDLVTKRYGKGIFEDLTRHGHVAYTWQLSSTSKILLVGSSYEDVTSLSLNDHLFFTPE